MEYEPTSEGGDLPTSGDPGAGRIRSRGSFVRGLYAWARAGVLALAFFLAVRTFGIEAFKIPTASMEGTLLVGDFLLVNKAVYGAKVPGTDIGLPALREPARGDVVVFHPPHDPDRNYVKRLVGLPGDTLEMRDKTLHLNGEAVDEPWARYIDDAGDTHHDSMEWQANHLVANPRRYFPSRDSWGPIVVPEEGYFVLGDNRDNSEDSRYWGFVDREAIKGQPWRVYYSFAPDAGTRFDWLTGIRWDRVGHLVR